MPIIRKSLAVITVLAAGAVSVMLSLSSCASTAQPEATDDALEVVLFGSRTCHQCHEIKTTLLYPLERELGGKLNARYLDTEDAESFELMLRMEKQYGVPAGGSPQELFFPDTFLLGYDDIMEYARAMINKRLDDPHSKRVINVEGEARDVKEIATEGVASLTLAQVIIGGAVDSVNPCAIATMIFLVSFLATQKRRRLEVLITGLSFTFAVFLTYLALGLGAFAALTALQPYFWIATSIKWAAVAFAGVIGILCLIDAFRYKKTGNAKDIKLQLPKSIKMRIHKIITTKMTGSRLYIGAFVAGFLVTLLEAVCTGQVYLPIIIAIQHTTGKTLATAWFYLILYNLIFILPLIAVMIAAYYGMKWNTLSKIMQKNLTIVKVSMGVLLIGLALYLALSLV